MGKFITSGVLLCAIFLSAAFGLSAQYITLDQDFEQETPDSIWIGDPDHFSIFEEPNGNRLLRLDNEEASGSNNRSQLHTASSVVYGQWEFYIEVPAVSSSNRVYIYLISDSDKLDIVGNNSPGVANGYAIHTGGGSFDLVRLDNGSAVTILTSDTEIGSEQGYQIRVTRSREGEWQLFVAEGYGSQEFDASEPVTDDAYTESGYFGLFIRYSSGNNQDFYFDDIIITEDVTDLFVEHAEVLRANQADLLFSNPIDEHTLDQALFIINNGADTLESRVLIAPDRVRLTFPHPFAEGNHLIAIRGISDIYGQQIDSGTELTLTVTNPFRLLSAEVVTATKIAVLFTIPPDESAWIPADFEISGRDDTIARNPESVEYRGVEAPNSLFLNLTSPMQTGDYLLAVQAEGGSTDGWPVSGNTTLGFSVENPFYITGVSARNRAELEIVFSQPVESAEKSNFSVRSAGEPSYVQIVNENTVLIAYETPVNTGRQEVTISHVKSVHGWEIEPESTAGFDLFDYYEPGDLVITEFFYRTPVTWRTSEFSRPQYVEIYNRSDKVLNLRNYTLNGFTITGDANLPIRSDEYLVITRGVAVFENWFDNTDNVRNFVEAHQFPTLNLTTSSVIELAADDGVVVESLEYNAADWGGNGVALERVDFSAPANYRDNWSESEDALLGSPGLKNTIRPPDAPPEVVSAAFPSPYVLHLTFSRTLSENSIDALTSYVLNEEVSIESVNRAEWNARMVEFHLDRRLNDQADYSFTYTDIDDIFGNSATGDFSFTFENPFRILSAGVEGRNDLVIRFTLPAGTGSCETGTFALADNSGSSGFTCDKDDSETIRLTFDSPFDTGRYQIIVNGLETVIAGLPAQWLLETNASAEFFQFDEYQPGDLVLNEFMYRPPPGYPKYVEIKNVSDRFLNLKNFELRRAEGALSNGGAISEMDVPVEPNGFTVITEDSELLQSVFGNGPWIEMRGFPGYTVTVSDQIRFLDPGKHLIEEVHYHPATWGGNGVSLERRSTEAAANNIDNWGESEAGLLGTPGLENTVQPGDQAPHFLLAEFMDDKTILASFSGFLDQSRIDASHFSINRGHTIEGVRFISERVLELTLGEAMDSGVTYTVTARNIADIFGNTLDEAEVDFTYYFVQEAEPGDIVINEFMYRPPENYTRYIELFNRSDKAVDLSGWKQANNTGTRRILTTEQVILPPGKYMVLLPNYNLLAHFPDLPAMNAGTAFAALKSAGDAIVITNAEDVVIDSLTYHPSWGGDGVALERRRSSYSPLYAENWGDSPAEKYGTPGQVNEVDKNFELLVNRIEATGRQIVEIGFNTPIRESTVSAGNFQTDGASPQRAVLVDDAVVRLHFSQPLPAGGREMTIRSIESRGGFEIADGYTVSFTIFDAYEEGDILVNEFMYRPPDTHPRYIELYNRSEKLLNLKGWRLQRKQVGGEPDRFIATEDLSIQPEDYLVITDDISTFNNIYPDRNVIELSSYPAFTVTTADQIRIFTPYNVLADSLAYNPAAWGGNGVALERLMLDLPSDLRANWEESPNTLLGTPGLPNDARPDPSPPQILSTAQFENLGFHLVFDKRLDEETVLNRENYQIDPGLGISMVGMDEEGILLFAEGHLVSGQVYTIKVKGIKDLFGNEMEPAETEVRYLEFGTVQPGDLAINEILYRRRGAGEPQFVEIYNQTEINADLSGWLLSDEAGSAVIPGGTAIRANDYLVFTDEPSFAAASENIVHLPGFQPLGNNGDAVVLKNLYGAVIDSVYYRPDWGDHTAGISLERKDPSALSIDPANWAPSTVEKGSTPAEKNSRFEPDLDPPAIRFANLVHPDSIEVIFDSFVNLIEDRESREPQRAIGPAVSYSEQRITTRFLVNGTEAEILLYNPHQANRMVLSTSGLRSGEELILTAENLVDFQGNRSAALSHPVAHPLQPGDLVINEIMFHPIADSHDGIPDQSEYIEIYNRMPYAVSLEGVFLHNTPDENGAITRLDPVSSLNRWIPALGYALFYPEPDAIGFDASRTAQFFNLTEDFAPFAMQMMRNTLSLPNSGREVYLADSTGTVIDNVNYSDTWHNPNINDTRGISLERINPALDSDNPSNWGSHTSPLGGTPGSENSLYQPSAAVLADVGMSLSPNPFSPDDDGFEDYLMIHYKLDEPGYLLKIRIYDRYGRLVRRLRDGTPAGLEETVVWDGRNDEGMKNRIGIYIVVAEAYNSTTGNNQTFRQPVVIARQF